MVCESLALSQAIDQWRTLIGGTKDKELIPVLIIHRSMNVTKTDHLHDLNLTGFLSKVVG